MATDINSVVLVGRLTRDAMLRYSSSGAGFLSFTVAVNRSKRNADGSWTDEPSFIDCVYFGQNSQSISQYLVKGKQVAVQGELRQSKWETDGQQRSRVEIFVNNLTLLGQGQGGSVQRPQQPQTAYSPAPHQAQAAPSAPEMAGPEEFQDDNIPF